MQNAECKINLFVIDETLCKPTAHRLIVEFQTSVCKRDVDCKDHYHHVPSLAKCVEFVLYQPGIEEVHYRIVHNVERIGYIAQEFAECR